MLIKASLFLFLALTTNIVFCQNKSDTFPPKGKLVDVGGRRLHILCSGKGSPTVILVAGGGAFAIDWTLVQSKVENDTRVCSYDRAGFGWSDPGPAEETVEEEIDDLHKLLQRSGEKGPYILVGASIGGIYIQAYQHKYPKEVAGLIFTNSSNHIGFPAKNKTGLIWDLTEEDIRSTFPFPPSNEKHKAVTSATEPFDKIPHPEQDMWIYLTERMMQKWDTAKSTAESTLSWRKEFLREFDESDKLKGQYPLGSLPVVVVSSDPKADDSLRYSRSGAAGRLDFLSSNSIHITAPESGHEIHLYQPAKVIEAIEAEIQAIRKHQPLSVVQVR